MKRLLAITILIVSIQAASYAEIIFVNPGIKIGYSFGQGGGFTFGYEISIVAMNFTESRYGIVYSYDTFGEFVKHHIGVEYMYRVGGIDVGVTYLKRKEEQFKTGISVIPFGGALILPYYNFTYIDHQTMFHEVGTYGKIFIGDVSWFKIQ